MLRLAAMSILCGAILQGAAVAADWPGFRGAAGTGISTEKNLPVKWSSTENLAWQTDLPGRGNSSPAIVGDRVYLTAQTDDHGLWVIAIDRASGDIAWSKNVGSGELAATGGKELYAHRHNAATPTPAADAEHVWAFFGTGLIVCLDRDGNPKWQRNLTSEFGQYDIAFGMAASPRLWGDRVYVISINKGPSYVAALDKRTGDTVWKTPRKLPANDDGQDSYSSPVVWQAGGKSELIVSGADHVDAYDLASGAQNWVSSGLKIDSVFGRICASPGISEDTIVVCSGNPAGGGLGHAIALKAGGKGDVTTSHRLWKYAPYSSDSPSPIVQDGLVYMLRDDGIASCVDVKTGEQRYRKRLESGEYRASAILGDGKLYCVNLAGLCTVLEAGAKGNTLAENQLAGTFYATPAISDGVVYLRAFERLYAVSAK